MSSKSWVEISTIHWRSKDTEPTRESIQRIKVGCLQRIAEATELMAQNHQELIDQRDMYQRWYKEASRDLRSEKRSKAALRGVITKLKKQIERLEMP